MKKLLTMIVALALITSTLLLTSCAFVENVMDNIGDMIEDKIEEKAKDAMNNADYGNKYQETSASDTPVEVDRLNGKTVENVYSETENFLYSLTEYQMNGVRYTCMNDATNGKRESNINFNTTVAKNTVYSKLSSEDASMGYYYVDGYKYWVSETGSTATLLDDPESMSRSEFISDNVIGFDFSNFGNWVEPKYINLNARAFTKIGDEYILTLALTDSEVKYYYEKKVGLSIVTSAELTVEMTFDKNGKLTKYDYDTQFIYNDENNSPVTNNMRWNINITKTENVSDVTLPAGITKANNSSGGSSSSSSNGDSVNEAEDPSKIGYYNNVKYYLGTEPKVGDMNNDGKVTEFDLYCQDWGDYEELDGNGVVNYYDIVESGLTQGMIKSIFEQYAMEYNKTR